MKKTNNFKKIEEFRKKTAINEKLGLDERDNILLSLIQKNPEISQEAIAKKIKLSQPSVGMRLKKLQKKGILHLVNGVNFKIADLILAKVEITSRDTKATLKEFSDCPFFLNGLITSGKHNLCLLFASTSLKRLEGIVNHHLRKNPLIKDLEMNLVISTAKDFIMPLNIDYENKKQINCKQECLNCV